ncbi:thioredoxin family protein [Chloroflexota bacterium]
MTPIVDGLEQQYGKQIAVRRVNAAEGDGPAIMQNYRIPGHPTLMIFDSEGQEVKRLIGPQPVTAVEETMQEVLASTN